MKNSKIFRDVMIKDGVAVVSRAIISYNGELNLERENYTLSAGINGQSGALALVGQELANLTQAGIAERVAIIIPESVVIRCAEATKHLRSGVNNAEELYFKMMKPWMTDLSKVTAEEAAGWKQGLQIFSSAFLQYRGTVVFVNARKLYRWQVRGAAPDGSDLVELAGKEIQFTAGINEELGLVIEENKFYNQKAKISVNTIRDRQGNVRHTAYVPRMVFVTEADGTQGWITTLDASNLDRKITASDNYAVTITAVRLHVKTAMGLPKHVIVNKINVHEISKG